MLLLSLLLLPSIGNSGKRKEVTYPLLIFRVLFPSPPLLFFSELSNYICLCTAVHVCLWHEAAGMKPGMEWADSVSLTGCRYSSYNFSMEPWPGVAREELPPAAFPSDNSGRCRGDPARCWSLVPAMEQEFSCFLEPQGFSGKLQNPTPIPTPLLLSGASGSAQGWAETVSALKHFHLKKIQRRVGWENQNSPTMACRYPG